MKKTILISALAFVLFSMHAYSAGESTYVSPDGKYRAWVISLPNGPYAPGESRITIKTRNGTTLVSKSYGSKDGEHGFGVEKAAWTSDSKFFVYSMSSSGGHQPWHFPTEFISIADGKVRSLGDYVGAVIDPDFIVSAPGIVRVMRRDNATSNEASVDVGLAELVTRKKK